MAPVVRTGLDVLLHEESELLRGRRVGLVTNPSAVGSDLRSTIDLLSAHPGVRLAALFAPEHGIRGEAQAGAHIADEIDRRSGVPVFSLYGDTRMPTAESLSGLDALVFDLQDVGVRYATYFSTLVLVQEAAAVAGTTVVVLDRPAPIDGVSVEGPSLADGFASFVGIHPVPVRHGLTIGELALLVAKERGWPAPSVLRMRGWARSQWYDDTGLPWVQPSPNLPTLDAVTLYPGTCLVEGTNVSEGRGTTRPFELVGAPWIDPFALAEDLGRQGIAGVRFRPAYFTPMFSKHAGASCGGVQVHVIDRRVLRPVALGVHLLDALRAQDPKAFAWRRGVDGRHFVDLLYGSDRLRRSLDEGVYGGALPAAWSDDVARFAERRSGVLLYE